MVGSGPGGAGGSAPDRIRWLVVIRLSRRLLVGAGDAGRALEAVERTLILMLILLG